MKYINKITGAIIEPRSEMVDKQLAKSPDYEVYVEPAPVASDAPKPKKGKGK